GKVPLAPRNFTPVISLKGARGYPHTSELQSGKQLQSYKQLPHSAMSGTDLRVRRGGIRLVGLKRSPVRLHLHEPILLGTAPSRGHRQTLPQQLVLALSGNSRATANHPSTYQ